MHLELFIYSLSANVNNCFILIAKGFTIPSVGLDISIIVRHCRGKISRRSIGAQEIIAATNVHCDAR